MIELENARVTLLLGEDGIKIELYDADSGTQFCEVRIEGAEKALQALNRHGHVPCKTKLRGLGRVGKVLETDKLEFSMADFPTGCYDHEKRRAHAEANATRALQMLGLAEFGWVPDTSFSSRESFFHKGTVPFARTMIRRWVEKG